MMSGAKRQHDRITINLIVAVDARLRGRTCQPTIQDTGVKISDVQISRPDMAIDCGPFHRDAYIASNPRAVFEVLSRSTRVFDHTKKLEEYKSVASLSHMVLIDPDSPAIIAFQRAGNGLWQSLTISGLEAEIEFADLDFTLSLAEIYRDISFRAKPILVMEDDDKFYAENDR